MDNDLEKRVELFIRKLWDKLRRWEQRGSSLLYRKEIESYNPYNVIWNRTSNILEVPSLKKFCAIRFATIRPVDEPFSISTMANLLPTHDFLDEIRKRVGKTGSCAVVSSSGSLIGPGRGSDIDSHDVVIRFNNAPTSGYESEVGNKTTIRILNSKLVANQSFDIRDPLYANSINFVWDPSNYDVNLDKWYATPDHPFFLKYMHSRLTMPHVPFYIINPNVLWSAWRLLQSSTKHQIRKSPPSSGFLGFLLATQICSKVVGFEYIPSIRLTEMCHYYDDTKSMGCTFGDWHPLASEKLFLLKLNSASDYDVVVNGRIQLLGCST